GRQVEQRTYLVRYVLHVPDVGARGRQLYVTHTVAPHRRAGDFDPATLTGLASEPLTAVLAAGAFPVLLGTEDALVEETVSFRLQGPVVDRLRLSYLAVA